MNVSNRLILFFYISLLFSCANIVAPTGGKIDTEPPKLVFSSVKNGEVNFASKEIELIFDELITVNKALITVAPELPEKMDISSDSKRLILKINSEFEANTTYQINFSGAIKDLNEGTVLNDFNFVFSTGALLDSGVISSNVVDALSHLPSKALTVGLYHVDSLIMGSSPAYTTQTSEKGDFVFRYLPQKKFKIFAFDDNNVNRRYDRGEAFTNIYQNSDSVLNQFYLNSDEEFKSKISDFKLISKGILRLMFTQKPKHIEVKPFGFVSSNNVIYFDNDTLKCYFKQPEADSLKFIVHFDSKTDTIKIIRSGTFQSLKPKIEKAQLDTISVFSSPFYINNSIPIRSFDRNNIRVTVDSTFVKYGVDIHNSFSNLLIIDVKYKFSSEITIEFLPKAIEYLDSQVNMDTVLFSYKIPKEEELGEIILENVDT